jgi:predicted MFS family arabinose efflux permease
MLTYASATKYSWLAFAPSFATALTFVALGRTKRWQHSFVIPVITQVLAAMSFWTLGHTRSLLMMLACFVAVGVNVGLAFFSSIFYCVSNPAHKHRRASINEGAVGFGGLVGNLVFGFLVARYGHATPYHLTPIIVTAAILLQALFIFHGRRRCLATTA